MKISREVKRNLEADNEDWQKDNLIKRCIEQRETVLVELTSGERYKKCILSQTRHGGLVLGSVSNQSEGEKIFIRGSSVKAVRMGGDYSKNFAWEGSELVDALEEISDRLD